MNERLEGLRRRMAENGCDGFISMAPPINQYLTGFRGTTSMVVVTQGGADFLCDFRYTEQAGDQVDDAFAISEVKGALGTRLAEWMNALDISQAAFDPASMSVAERMSIESVYRGVLKPVDDLVAPLRMVKDAVAIGQIRTASALAEGALADTLPQLQTGVTESDFAALLEYEFKKRGARGPSFDTIVLFGPRSSLPHGMPGNNALEPGDVVLIDFGCRKNGVCSDLTRTYSFGTISGSWFETVYTCVLEAQLKAIDAIRPGLQGKEIDKVARDHIAQAGYGDYFGHGLGHGLGIEIHEAPRLNPESDTVLAPGMVVTVEPGIYLPGKGGVRIEDVVAVTEDGCEVLSTTPKDLKVLPV
jgi:Xaa-Pro aminopeptidase